MGGLVRNSESNFFFVLIPFLFDYHATVARLFLHSFAVIRVVGTKVDPKLLSKVYTFPLLASPGSASQIPL